MCGRYVSPDEQALTGFLRSLPQRNIRRQLGTLQPDYNVVPTRDVPAIRQHGEQLELLALHWGLIPFWARGEVPKYSTINATVEKIESAPTWRGPWKRSQRCLLPALGFYEWQLQPDGRSRQPYYIQCADQPVFAFAGLWDASRREDGTAVESCTIITLPASALMETIHNTRRRMPAILAAADLDAWLSGSPDDARAVLKPYADDLLLAWPVSTRVNSPRNQGPELVARLV